MDDYRKNPTPADQLSKTVEIGCPQCKSTGFYPDPSAFCPSCNGRGIVEVAASQAVLCPHCHGHSHGTHSPCIHCASTGYAAFEKPPFKRVIQELGLPDGASEADAHAAVLKIKSRLAEFEKIQAEAPAPDALESQAAVASEGQPVASAVNPS